MKVIELIKTLTRLDPNKEVKFIDFFTDLPAHIVFSNPEIYTDKIKGRAVSYYKYYVYDDNEEGEEE